MIYRNEIHGLQGYWVKQMALEVKLLLTLGIGPVPHLFMAAEKLIICKEPRPRKISPQITVLPWKDFCAMLWAGEIL
jgi:hypothetical protein